MSAPTITPLTDPPARDTTQAAFVAACKLWFAALVTFVTQMVAFRAWISAGTGTVASLPTLAAGDAGARSFVSDANSATFGAAVAGGGSNKVPVVWNGAIWQIG